MLLNNVKKGALQYSLMCESVEMGITLNHGRVALAAEYIRNQRVGREKAAQKVQRRQILRRFNRSGENIKDQWDEEPKKSQMYCVIMLQMLVNSPRFDAVICSCISLNALSLNT